MRAACTVLGLARGGDLWTAIVPVSASRAVDHDTRWVAQRSARVMVVPLGEPAAAARGWLRSATARTLVAAAQPLPRRARLVSPACGETIVGLTAGVRFHAVWLLRSYLAGAAIPFLDLRPRPRAIVDVDEDDAAVLAAIADLHHRRGEPDLAAAAYEEAAAYGRLGSACLRWFDGVVAASAPEARALEQRYALERVEVLRNALPPRSMTGQAAADPASPPASGRVVKIVFVGNLEYVPNRDAVERLVMRIFPLIRAVLPGAELHIAGAGDSRWSATIAGNDGVHVHGFLDDLATLYAGATLAVVPLRAGGGSRLKILEAFANAVPVVATSAAVAGLEVRGDAELLMASSDEELAAAAIRIATDSSLAARLAHSASTFVAGHHDVDATAARVANIAGLDG